GELRTGVDAAALAPARPAALEAVRQGSNQRQAVAPDWIVAIAGTLAGAPVRRRGAAVPGLQRQTPAVAPEPHPRRLRPGPVLDAVDGEFSGDLFDRLRIQPQRLRDGTRAAAHPRRRLYVAQPEGFHRPPPHAVTGARS